MKTKPRYKAHYGKSQPVADDVIVEVVFAMGYISIGSASGWYWGNDVGDGNIIAYRILEDEQ